MMAFTQIMAIWTPAITLEDHLNDRQADTIGVYIIIYSYKLLL